MSSTIYSGGYRKDIFRPEFPKDVRFTHAGSLWWTAHLTQEQVQKLDNAGIEHWRQV